MGSRGNLCVICPRDPSGYKTPSSEKPTTLFPKSSCPSLQRSTVSSSSLPHATMIWILTEITTRRIPMRPTRKSVLWDT
ncbi:hypothetical protein ATCV1_z011L [Acanthocystis turfacea chlorella virus 1]|uniref:Uncharacterized protein z011L n=1 Tax=Chlorovirus heliozoae TaxID=322019 RepID=A7K7X1_9PHYC|nr:hypothetical protein ATCV1_z011L [Acanthocystis turfacea chlorella virus 1]ABT16145.1 hypothetical protein ATCV1_z011L [Acanthocystis turfacea chlorella virus 1]